MYSMYGLYLRNQNINFISNLGQIPVGAATQNQLQVSQQITN